MKTLLIIFFACASIVGHCQTQPRANQIKNTASGNVSATNVQNAINELDADLSPSSESFTATINFDKIFKYSSTTQTGDINITLGGGTHIDGAKYQMTIVGNSTNALTISTAFNVDGVLDPRARNTIFFYYLNSGLKPYVKIVNEPLNTFINDYSLGINTATPNNSVSFSDAGSTLDGTNGSGTDVAFSVTAWIKLNSLSANHIIAARSSSSVLYFQFIVDSSNKLSVSMATDASNYITKTQTTASLQAGIWTHVAVVKAAAEAHTAFTLYINGVAVASGGGMVGTYTGIANGGAFKVGWQDVGGSTTGDFNIDQVAFWDNNLTDAQIIEIYNGGFPFDLLTSSPASNLVMYHSFENVLTDLKGNGHTGTSTTPLYETTHP